MNAILWPVFDYVAKNRWLQIVLAVLTGWVFVMIYLHFRDSGVRERERADQKRRALEEQARVDAERRAINQENEDASQAADQAVRDLPRYRHTEQLRNSDSGVSEIVLGPDPRHGR